MAGEILPRIGSPRRVAIVTGGGAGLGRELTVGLAGAGFTVVVADVDGAAAEASAARAEQVAGAAAGAGPPAGADAAAGLSVGADAAAGADSPAVAGGVAVAVCADVTDAEQARGVVRVAAELGGPHVLVNNAGGWTRGGRQYPDAEPADWAATLALNLTAPMLLTQLVREPMRRLGGGVVVNVASSAARGDGAYGSPEYAAAKAGLVRLTTSLAGLDGVRVTCIVPDWIGLDRAHAEFAALSPAERAVTPPLIPPAQVVDAVLDLIAGGASGTVVELRGGREPIPRRPA